MSEKDYDGILSSIATLINMYSFKYDIRLDFSKVAKKDKDKNELYIAMAAMIAEIYNKDVFTNLNFFARKWYGKKYNCKIKKLKNEKNTDVSKLMQIIEVTYKDTLDIEYLKAKDLIDYYLKTKGK